MHPAFGELPEETKLGIPIEIVPGSVVKSRQHRTPPVKRSPISAPQADPNVCESTDESPWI